jgi:hypothetical protein
LGEAVLGCGSGGVRLGRGHVPVRRHSRLALGPCRPQILPRDRFCSHGVNDANDRRADDTAMNAELKEVERWNDPAAQFLTVSLASLLALRRRVHSCASGDASRDAILDAETKNPGFQDSPKLTPRRPRSERRARSARCTRVRTRRTASALRQGIGGTVSVSN